MKRLLTTLVILTGLFGSGGAVWADLAGGYYNTAWEAEEAGDYAEAAKWYRKAADEGLAIAQFRLGSMYALGEGVSQDDAEAKKWFREAADQGYAKAQNDLGEIYLNGGNFTKDRRTVRKDYAEALKWFRKA